MPAGSAQQGAAPAGNPPLAGSKRAAARRGGAAVAGWWLAEAVARGEGALGAAVEADMRSGRRARREQGRGWVPHLVGRGGDRRAENVEDEAESNEEARASVADAARSEGARCARFEAS